MKWDYPTLGLWLRNMTIIKPRWLCLILLIVAILSYFGHKINYCVKNKAVLTGRTKALNKIISLKLLNYQCLTCFKMHLYMNKTIMNNDLIINKGIQQ